MSTHAEKANATISAFQKTMKTAPDITEVDEQTYLESFMSCVQAETDTGPRIESLLRAAIIREGVEIPEAALSTIFAERLADIESTLERLIQEDVDLALRSLVEIGKNVSGFRHVQSADQTTGTSEYALYKAIQSNTTIIPFALRVSENAKSHWTEYQQSDAVRILGFFAPKEPKFETLLHKLSKKKDSMVSTDARYALEDMGIE